MIWTLKMCLLLFGSNSLKVWVLFDMNSGKVFNLIYLIFYYHFLTIRMVLNKNNFTYIWFSWSFCINLNQNFCLARSNATRKLHYINRIYLSPVWFRVDRNSSLPNLKLRRAGKIDGWVPLVHLDRHHLRWKRNSSNTWIKGKSQRKLM